MSSKEISILSLPFTRNSEKKGDGIDSVAPGSSVKDAFHSRGTTLFPYPATVKLVYWRGSEQHFQSQHRFPGERFSNDSILLDELWGNPF
jgi:hypothetical protein